MTALHRNMYDGNFCCASIMLKTGFDLEDVEDETALTAIEGLCGGMRSGKYPCGVLSGACCMISFLAPEDAPDMIPELTQWFSDNYTQLYGGINCSDIKRCPEDAAKCQQVMEQTYQKAMEILEAHGYEYE